MSHKQLLKNTSALFVLQMLNYIFPLLLLPYLTRVLGIKIFGIYAFSISLIQIASIITDYGFNLYATYEISKNRENKEYVNDILGSVYLIKTCIFVVVALLIVVYFMLNQKYENYRVFLVLSLVPIAGMTFQPIWFFQGVEQMKYITIYTGVAKLTYVVIVFMSVSHYEHINRIVLANGFSQVVAALIGWGLIKRLGYTPRLPERAVLLKVFNGSRGFFWSRAAAASYTSAGSFYLGLFAAPSQVAVFAAAEQLYKAVQNVFTPLVQSLYPFMARKPDYQLFSRILLISSLAMASLSWFCYLLAPGVIRAVYGPQFGDAYGVFKIFLFMLAITIPSMMLGYPFLGSFGMAGLANTSVIVAGCLQIFLLILLYVFNLVSAVWVAFAILLVEVLVLAIRGGFGWRFYKKKRKLNEI